MQRGNNRRAGQLFLQISRADNVADSLKSRATQMAGMLGVDAVVDDDAQQSRAAANDQPATKE
jgi:hypothetical protein